MPPRGCSGRGREVLRLPGEHGSPSRHTQTREGQSWSLQSAKVCTSAVRLPAARPGTHGPADCAARSRRPAGAASSQHDSGQQGSSQQGQRAGGSARGGGALGGGRGGGGRGRGRGGLQAKRLLGHDGVHAPVAVHHLGCSGVERVEVGMSVGLPQHIKTGSSSSSSSSSSRQVGSRVPPVHHDHRCHHTH